MDEPGETDGEERFAVQKKGSVHRRHPLQAPCEQGRRQCRAEKGNGKQAWKMLEVNRCFSALSETARPTEGSEGGAKIQQGSRRERTQPGTEPLDERRRDPEGKRGENREQGSGGNGVWGSTSWMSE